MLVNLTESKVTTEVYFNRQLKLLGATKVIQNSLKLKKKQ